ncbi:MAG: glycosyltransferase [Muribaculaceae bacterium]|nr:glycosyltransferase [Muribaculaceae bacterium]
MSRETPKPLCLIVSTVASGGSTGAAVRRDALEALDRGMRVVVASGRASLPAELKRMGVRHISIGSRIDADDHYLLARLFDAEGRGSILATLRFLAVEKDLRPERIILHNLHGHYLNLRLFVRRLQQEARRGVEIVWTMHDFWPVTGHCAFLPHEGCLRFTEEAGGCRDCPMTKAYPASIVDRSARNFARKRALLAPLADAIKVRAVSRWQAALLRRSFLGKARIEVCSPAPDPVFTPLPAAAFRPGFVLCAAYPWQKYKGLDDLKALREAIPADVDMLVVGVSKRQARKLRPLGIICAPLQDKPEKMAWYFRNASVFVNPSYAETYGLTTREALACDTPVALYAVGGAIEGIEDHPKVRAVPCGDVAALARAALELRAL